MGPRKLICFYVLITPLGRLQQVQNCLVFGLIRSRCYQTCFAGTVLKDRRGARSHAVQPVLANPSRSIPLFIGSAPEHAQCELYRGKCTLGSTCQRWCWVFVTGRNTVLKCIADHRMHDQVLTGQLFDCSETLNSTCGVLYKLHASTSSSAQRSLHPAHCHSLPSSLHTALQDAFAYSDNS